MASFKYLAVLVLTLPLVFASEDGIVNTDGQEGIKSLDYGPELTEEDFANEKVAGGVITTVERFPYQVSIRVANITICGGFILSKNWVMTSAHCVDGALIPLITVRAGSTALNTGGTLFTALRYLVHSLYNASQSNDYDFALVEINGTFTFSSAVKAIAIPTQSSRLPTLGNIIVAGWGLISENNPASLDLRAVSIKIIPQKLCRLLYTGTATITARMFCAGKLILGGRGSCQVYEMFVAGYQFQVLSPIFTCHWGLQNKKSRPVWRERQNSMNRRQFDVFKREVFARYHKDPLRMLQPKKAKPQKG